MVSENRKIVLDTLNFENPSRVPHQIWDVPWSYIHYPEQMKAVRTRFPDDIVWCPRFLKVDPPTKGDPYEIGQYVDEWGCVFENRQKGVIGEVKQGLVSDEEWEDGDRIRLPEEFLNLDVDAINAYCRDNDQFVLAGSSVRLFERMQFFAGTQKVLMDLLEQPDGMLKVLDRTHAFFCEELEAWAKTDVDGLFIQDDWGAQINLLISPKLWVEMFKSRYADYAAIARKYGKKLFMHSDGYIVDIMWYVVDCEEDASLYYGFSREVSPEELRQRIRENTLLEVLNKVYVKKGDVLFIEAGTIHAIGKGCLIAEIQQNSNLTYRVYDYGRKDKNGKERDLHIEKALQVTNRIPILRQKSFDPHIASCEYFTVDKLVLDGKLMQRVSGTVDPSTFVSILVLEGEGQVCTGAESMTFRKGDSLLITANTGAYEVRGTCEALVTTIS